MNILPLMAADIHTIMRMIIIMITSILTTIPMIMDTTMAVTDVAGIRIRRPKKSLGAVCWLWVFQAG